MGKRRCGGNLRVIAINIWVDALMRPLHSPQNPKVNTALVRYGETAPRINTQPLFRCLVKNWHRHTHRRRHL